MNTDQRHASQSTEDVLPDVASSHLKQDDTDLVKASQHGDQNAFALLVQRHQHRVFAMSVRILQDPEEANEATQEAFLAAWQGLPAFRGDALFSSWLYRITYHCCVRVLDLRKREHLLQEGMQAEQTRSEMGKEQQAMENIERHDQQDMLQKNLEHLPAKYRIVLRLRYLQDRTYEEMADILAMPIGTIKTHLFRAKRLLKERLIALHLESTV
jgi:RNA polymerase sigma-70 factor, ECF subfamily